MPSSAIVDDAGRPIVFVQVEGEAFERRPVTLGTREGDLVQVMSGVKPGGLELQIGFEDLPNATGDRDFQDVVIGIHVTGDGFLFT